MTTSNYYRRRPKAGSTAIPFMITFLIGLFVFGGAALYFYNKLTEKANVLKPMPSATTNISDADINSILFVLDPDEVDRKNAIMLLRFDPVRKNIFCIGIPCDLQVVLDNKSMTVDTCYVNHGMESLKSAVSQALDQPIDRYIKMDSTGFKKFVNWFGNLQYRIPIRDTGLKPSDQISTLDNDQFETMLTSLNYNDEMERCTIISLSVAALLNQCMGGEDPNRARGETDGGTRIAKQLDKCFSSVINAVTTDITAMDFSNHRHAISYMFEFAKAPARGMIFSIDTLEDGTVVANKAFLDNLKVSMYQVVASSNSESSEEKSEE